MKMNLKYNLEPDEFDKDISLERRIDNYISNHFYPIKIISELSNVYLIGGGIRDLMLAKNPKDLDFVILNEKDYSWVFEVLNRFKYSYTYNRFGGLKISFGDIMVDLWITNDLFDSIQYNVDGLFYNVKHKEFLSLTFEDFVKNGLREVNQNNNINNGREKKLIAFMEEAKKYQLFQES